MLKNGEKLGAFIVPTGIGASIGGYAGDASAYAQKFAKISNLIVNPNVVNAGCFSGITDKMLYVEGFAIDEFFKGNIHLSPSHNNKIGIVFDKAIPRDVLNIHVNTFNAIKCIYGIDIKDYTITEQEVGVDFCIDKSGISTGSVKNIQTLLYASKKLLDKGCTAIALVCLFDEPENDNPQYCKGQGVDPVGGIEAVLSHFISKELQVPCAHAPAFKDYTISSKLVDYKAAAEYITPTFLPCILQGLNNAPLLNKSGCISIDNLDFLIMPYNSLGSTPVFEAAKRGIDIFAIKENSTILNITADKINLQVIEKNTYDECFQYIVNKN